MESDLVESKKDKIYTIYNELHRKKDKIFLTIYNNIYDMFCIWSLSAVLNYPIG